MIHSKELTLNLRRRNRLHDRGAQLVHARLVASGAAILDHDVHHPVDLFMLSGILIFKLTKETSIHNLMMIK